VTDKYATQRRSGKRTAREAANWPEGGYKALSKLAKELYSEVDLLPNKKQWNTRDLYHFQRYLIVLFYSKHALRGDLADVRIKAPYANNWLKKAGGTYVLHVGRHKTSRAHGAIELRLGGTIKEALDAFLPQATKLTDHGFLLSTLRGSNKLKRQDMLRLIRNVTKDRLGKNIGVQIIRVLKVSDAAPEIDKARELQKELGHSASMQMKYISR
jgi:nitrate/nitrite-specific signal transduction histidine kinase